MEIINLYVAWFEILAGFLVGAIVGMFFHREDWLGSYSSWPRRMLRLAHISFFGIAFINLTFVVTVKLLEINHSTAVTAWLYIIAAFSMPLNCFLSAFQKQFRHLFFIPALSLIVGTIIFIWKGILS